jgi:Aminomethyltransferase folate-binding domain
MSSIDNIGVRVLRLGMAGTLGYEVHGNLRDATNVYQAIAKAGEAFGITKLGRMAHTMSHTESGVPQMFMYFPAPLHADKGFVEYVGDHMQSGRAGLGAGHQV